MQLSATPSRCQDPAQPVRRRRTRWLAALTADRLIPQLQAAARPSSPQTVSSHLRKLLDGGLLAVQSSGRHRYYRLAGPEVAAAVEARSQDRPSPADQLAAAEHQSGRAPRSPHLLRPRRRAARSRPTGSSRTPGGARTNRWRIRC
ncbi:helix-turn-helix transcriptional regulator [Kribbella qitaiheensis]|uniref:Helix-turn-helix transcriptional regulator n=1 Tax=Kribbella qitaiheensis TaxID=1544730 RepID=A0A7G6X9S4_9ACTN|nr:helix-turn-helix transcriptional regulator [Kribbella qitaiheensis]